MIFYSSWVEKHKMHHNDIVHLRHHIYGICHCDAPISVLLKRIEMKMDKYENIFSTNPSIVNLNEAEGVILHKGKPPGKEHECSRCHQKKMRSAMIVNTKQEKSEKMC